MSYEAAVRSRCVASIFLGSVQDYNVMDMNWKRIPPHRHPHIPGLAQFRMYFRIVRGGQKRKCKLKSARERERGREMQSVGAQWNESRGAPSNDQLDNKTSNNKTRHVYTATGIKPWAFLFHDCIQQTRIYSVYIQAWCVVRCTRNGAINYTLYTK